MHICIYIYIYCFIHSVKKGCTYQFFVVFVRPCESSWVLSTRRLPPGIRKKRKHPHVLAHPYVNRLINIIKYNRFMYHHCYAIIYIYIYIYRYGFIHSFRCPVYPRDVLEPTRGRLPPSELPAGARQQNTVDFSEISSRIFGPRPWHIDLFQI